MMHHPNMHHQAMSGHPPQHMGGHQGMPGHHQMPPHQMHRENRHVTLTRVPLVGSGGAHGGHGGHAGHGQALGALGGVPVHHAAPHHAARPLHHPPQHHAPHAPHAAHPASLPPQLKGLRRGYGPGGAFGPGAAAGVLPPPYAPRHQPPHLHPHSGAKMNGDVYTVAPAPAASAPAEAAGESGAGAEAGAGATAGGDAADGGGEAARPAPAPAPAPAGAQANSKEKTPMCLVNELARYNKIKHQYRLTSETGPAHKKVFTVTLRLGDTEEYTAEGSSIKRAQHAAASAALGATAFPPPPPRAPQPHQPPHATHRHSVMPTVELNALAMKLCQPAVYSSVPPVAARGAGAGPAARVRGPPYRWGLAPPAPQALLYRVRVCVGGRAWLGEGGTPQAARHDAAARALHDLRPPPAARAPLARPQPAADPDGPPPPDDVPGEGGGGGGAEGLGEVKSPVSLVHELALKRGLAVLFAVRSERGPPHMRVFVTACTVGELETEGEGNGKKVSKRRAAERMLDEMRRRWPPALLRARPALDRRRHPPAKKKPRNLIKEGAAGGGAGCGSGAAGGDNPISRLAVARHAARARSPQYRVVEERGCARRREFLVQCDAPPHSATGLGPNKKAAKRRAAHNVLLAMEMNSAGGEGGGMAGGGGGADAGGGDASKTQGAQDNKRKEGETGGGSGTGAGEGRQPVPGVLLMDYHQPPANGVSEASAGAGAGAGGGGGGSSPGAKDQLLYLAQLLGFTVQFSDFPKRNHGEYLSLVSLSTEPPVMCHGGGPSTAHSHEQCARAALRALALMGLDAPKAPPALSSGVPAGGAAKAGVVGPAAAAE